MVTAADARRSVSLLGATGSIGGSTADLLDRHRDRFRVEAVTANTKADELARLARHLGARVAVIADETRFGALRDALAGSGIDAAAGQAAMVEAASRPVDLVVAGIMGAAGLATTFAAARHAKALALANKESLVCAGDLLIRAADAAGTALLPTDSEHNAIFQALGSRSGRDLLEIILTASGGPFRATPREALRAVTPAQALKHPTWTMGAKITIDSATLVNKGLELIEAHHLFAAPPSMLGVLVHPQSIVHGIVRFTDGSMLAQLGPPDMRVPISSCLAWPTRIETGVAPLDLARVGTLTFEPPDEARFPGLALARAAMGDGGGAPCVLNGANEVAVAAFLDGRLGFLGIPALIEATLDAARSRGLTAAPHSLDDVMALDSEARHVAAHLLPRIAATSW